MQPTTPRLDVKVETVSGDGAAIRRPVRFSLRGGRYSDAVRSFPRLFGGATSAPAVMAARDRPIVFLDDYIEQACSDEWAWGRMDCVHFAGDWIRAATGRDPLAPYRSLYDSALGAGNQQQRGGDGEAHQGILTGRSGKPS